MQQIRLREISAIASYMLVAGACQAWEPATVQPKESTPSDVQIFTDVSWKQGIFNGELDTYLEVLLIVRGDAATGAAACGNVTVDSINDENGQSLKGRLTFLAGMILTRQPGSPSPKDGAQISFGLHNPPPLKKLSELRGSFALRTGGRLQEVILKDALKHSNRAIDDTALKSLGITVLVSRTTRPAPTDPAAKVFTLSAPGESEDAQDVLELELRNGDFPVGGYAYPSSVEPKSARRTGDGNTVTRVQIADANGRPFTPLTTNVTYGSNIGKAKFCFKDKLPDGTQLQLTIHRDAREIRVPFAFNNIEIPPRKASEGNMSPALMPMPSTYTPNTELPAQPRANR
jgi:hypothetical protein